jgi:hypothetical protein
MRNKTLAENILISLWEQGINFDSIYDRKEITEALETALNEHRPDPRGPDGWEEQVKPSKQPDHPQDNTNTNEES